LIFLLQNEHLPTCSNFTWLHVDLQPVRVCSLALAVAFSQQMYQVASTTRPAGYRAPGRTLCERWRYKSASYWDVSPTVSCCSAFHARKSHRVFRV